MPNQSRRNNAPHRPYNPLINNSTVRTLVLNHTRHLPGRGHTDLVIFTLSVHHLSPEQMKALFQTLQTAHSGVWVVNHDQLCVDTPEDTQAEDTQSIHHLNTCGLPKEELEYWRE